MAQNFGTGLSSRRMWKAERIMCICFSYGLPALLREITDSYESIELTGSTGKECWGVVKR